MTYKFSERSLSKQVGVDERLVKASNLCIQKTTIDFAFYDGLRTLKEQRRYVENGVSWTMQSKHLDGIACDLVPYVNGQLRWEWESITILGEHFRNAWMQIYPNEPLHWGGCWCNVVGSSRSIPLDVLRTNYAHERIQNNLPVRSDGAHWEVVNILVNEQLTPDSADDTNSRLDELSKKVDKLEHEVYSVRSSTKQVKI